MAHIPMPGRVVYWTIHGCVYVFAIAFLGMIGALVLGVFEHDVRQWGWVGGVLLAAIGYPLGWVTFPAFKLKETPNDSPNQDTDPVRKPLGPIGGSLVGILLGLILGALFSFVAIIFWLSLALSPLTPDSWREGIHTSFFFANLPPWPTLGILMWTTGSFIALGIVLGLCGKTYWGGRQ